MKIVYLSCFGYWCGYGYDSVIVDSSVTLHVRNAGINLQYWPVRQIETVALVLPYTSKKVCGSIYISETRDPTVLIFTSERLTLLLPYTASEKADIRGFGFPWLSVTLRYDPNVRLSDSSCAFVTLGMSFLYPRFSDTTIAYPWCSRLRFPLSVVPNLFSWQLPVSDYLANNWILTPVNYTWSPQQTDLVKV